MGQRVDTSLLASLVGMLCVQGQRYLSIGDVPGRVGNDHPVIYPYGSFTAKDGPINVAAATPEMWSRLCRVLDLEFLEHAPDFFDNSVRLKNRDSLRQLLNTRLATRDAIDWTTELIAAGVPAGPIYTLDQVFDDPHVQHNRYAETVEHPVLGRLRQLANPLRMDSFGEQTVRMHPPLLGEHSAEVLSGFGYSQAEIDRFVAAGTIIESDGSAEDADAGADSSKND